MTDLQLAGLPAPSLVRCAKIATIEMADAERIGQLPTNDRTEVTQAIRRSFAQVLG